jgi:hypothetical protein
MIKTCFHIISKLTNGWVTKKGGKRFNFEDDASEKLKMTYYAGRKKFLSGRQFGSWVRKFKKIPIT